MAVYTDDGKLVREWGKNGKGDGEFDQPGGIVLGDDGTLYVADQGNHRVQSSRPRASSWPSGANTAPSRDSSTAPEPAGSRFGGPHFLARTARAESTRPRGSLGRVQQFSADGKPLLAWGDKGDQPGGFGG